MATKQSWIIVVIFLVSVVMVALILMDLCVMFKNNYEKLFLLNATKTNKESRVF
jgi:hypothetical protein